MTLASLCIGLFAMLIGLAVCFNGYRWFLIFLPIFGFFIGFFVGAGAMQSLFGAGFLVSVSSWVIGFVLGAIFAVLSYLFYFIAVALIGGGLGYALVVGVLQAIGLDMGLIVWLLGVVGGVIAAIATIVLNIQKWVIVAFTSVAGATVIIGSFFLAFGKLAPEDFSRNAVRMIIDDSFLWLVFWLLLLVLGFLAQIATTRNFVLEAPENRI
ncbi:MAG: DUF4203 domain-containing protein [Caldilineales bacterium]|nr:DUF4203 domain-containing protein [Caldilineales bacterium]